ncbi:Histone-lysine N-methyltransferase SETMAR-like [Oopsacas minuta]|uniref:Histone-lysine N-methyltransferase SETMAR-like n=1 Tax=Oopsacas minuta TaxID=111878 RepID=A0AAV7KDG5_9METZ|nr:Histone-lysine N-methyltransferase SETMAR-like [Oopsacas minuta]
MACMIPQPESDFTRRDFRAMILILFKLEESQSENTRNFAEALPKYSSCLRTVERWYSEFIHKNFILEDGPRPGRPSIIQTVQNVELVLDEVTKDPHVTYAQLEQETKLSSGSINVILHKELGLRKLCARWIPHSLSSDQKKCRVDFCKIMLKRFVNGTSRAVSEILTGDETWTNHYVPETKRRSKEWVEEGGLPPTKVRRIRSVGKQMRAIFFRRSKFVEGIALEDRKTVTADWYTTICLLKVFSAIRKQREKSGVRGILLHHDNASSHTALRTCEFLEISRI